MIHRDHLDTRLEAAVLVEEVDLSEPVVHPVGVCADRALADVKGEDADLEVLGDTMKQKGM